MNSKLKYIENWPELAREAKWSAAALAKLCNVSARTLHRHFVKRIGKNTKTWLAEQRQRQAIELLREGSSVKEASIFLGYKQQTNFARRYKYETGSCPSQINSDSSLRPPKLSASD
jgi:AraC-like DNA-binding protein